MKKILSLLSVLIISGTAVPTTIAASPYSKKETLNSGINFKQINNLKREKRQNNNITPELKISYEDINKYFSDLRSIINFLQNINNIRLINQETIGTTERYSETYFINSNNNNQYFIVPINIENSRRISLVFNSIDFYLQGFIGHPTSNNQTLNVYYYFRDATIRNISGVTGEVNINFDSTYTSLRGNSNSEILISWDNIIDSFNQISLYGENPDRFNSNPNLINQIKINFIRVILATSESLRFRDVRNDIINNHHNNRTGIWDLIFDRLLKNWDRISRNALDYLISFGTLIGFVNIHDISIFSRTLSNNFQHCKKAMGRSIDSNNNEYCFVFPEKTIHWRDDKKSFEIINSWNSNKLDTYIWSKEFNLGSFNPKNYNRIEFLGDTSNSRISWGNKAYYANSGFSLIEKSDFQGFLKDGNNSGCDQGQLLVGGPIFIIQNLQEKKGNSSINGDQWFAFCYYKNNSNYYLRFSTLQRVTSKNNSINGSLFLYIGRGLRLYNE